jgi:hypothetical protein
MQTADNHVPDTLGPSSSNSLLRARLGTAIAQSRNPPTLFTTGTEGQGLPSHHLNQIELARRWRISPRTLERWRWLRIGPRYIKIGGRVVYRLEDIEIFETARVHG